MKPRPNRKTGEYCNCAHCGQQFYKRKCEASRRFCSSKCGNTNKRKYKREIKQCQYCKGKFEYTPRPNSNSPGTYCSLKCRNDSYYEKNTKPTTVRPRWHSVRRRFVQKNDFCVICGIKGKLDVHHIIPMRIKKDNRKENLVSCCRKHHGMLEKYSDIIAKMPEEYRGEAMHLVAAKLEDYWHINRMRSLNGHN